MPRLLEIGRKHKSLKYGEQRWDRLRRGQRGRLGQGAGFYSLRPGSIGKF